MVEYRDVAAVDHLVLPAGSGLCHVSVRSRPGGYLPGTARGAGVLGLGNDSAIETPKCAGGVRGLGHVRA